MSNVPDEQRDQMAWRRDPDTEEPPEPSFDVTLEEEEARQQVQAVLEQRRPHVSVPELEPVAPLSKSEESTDTETDSPAFYRGPHLETPTFDPIFGFMVVGAVSIGLLPVEANVRYVILWILLGSLGLIGYVVGNSARVGDTSPDDMRVGIGLGIAIGMPIMILVGPAMATVSERMFDADGVPNRIMDTWVLMAVLFVIPAVEALFFRGVIQQFYNLVVTAVMATGWSMLLFYPHMSLGNTPGVAVSMGIFFALLNFLYSYVRYRNGLAAAWACQIVSGGLIWFMPRLFF